MKNKIFNKKTSFNLFIHEKLPLKFLKVFSFVMFSVLIFTSCTKEENLGDVENIPGQGGDTWVKGPIDQWLFDSLTVPYNIAAKYKWDQFELEVNKAIVPPKEEKVIPVMSVVKKVWIDTYVEEAGILFLKNIVLNFLY